MAKERVSVVIDAEEHVSEAAKNAKRAIEGIEKQTKETAKAGSSALGDFGKAFGGLTSSMTVANLAADAVRAGIRAIKQVISDSVSAFAEQERSLLRLSAAVRNNPMMSGSASASLQHYAEALQKTTIFGDDAIEQQATFLATLDLTEAQVKKTLKAAVELASSGIMSLDQATEALGRTWAGTSSTLGRSLPIVRDLTEAQLEAGKAVDLVASRFEGMADAALEGTSGALARAANLGDELKEMVGERLAPVVNGLANAFSSVASAILQASENAKALEAHMAYLKAGGWFGEQVTKLSGLDFLIPAELMTQIRLLAGMIGGEQGLYEGAGGVPTLRGATWQEQANAWTEVWNALRKLGLEASEAGRQMGIWKAKLWAPEPGPKYGSGTWMLGDHVPDTEAPGYAPEPIREVLTYAGDFSDSLQLVTEDTYAFREGMTDLSALFPNTTDALEELFLMTEKQWREAQELTVATTEVERAFSSLPGAVKSILESGRGSGGLEEAAGINASNARMKDFGDAVAAAATQAGGLAGQIAASVIQYGELGLLLEALKPVLEGIFDVVGPAVNEVLEPVMGALVMVGGALGSMLAPILGALVPVFDLLGMIIAAVIPVIDALSRPIQLVADLLGWFSQWIRYGVDQLKVFFWNLNHPFNQIEATIDKPEGFITDAFTRPLLTPNWDDLRNAGSDYLTTAGFASGSTTTVEHQPDIYMFFTIQGSIFGAGGMSELGKTCGQSLEAYAGIGGKIHIEEAIT